MTKKTPTQERPHAEISPSGFQNRKRCPGFKNDSTAAAHPVTIEGEMLHDIMEHDTPTDKLNEDQVGLINFCRDYEHRHSTGIKERVTEPRLEIFENVFGYPDRIYHDVKTGVGKMFDWKFGWNRVTDAQNNLQGKAYTVGAFNKYPHLRSMEVHFVQPRLGFTTSHTFTRDDVPSILDELKSIYASASNPDPSKFIFQEDLCCYCGRLDCPQLIDRGFAIAGDYALVRSAEKQLLGQDASTYDLPDISVPKALTDPDDVSKALALAPVLESWVRGVKEHARDMSINQGYEIPGFEIKHKPGRKNIDNAQGAWELVKEVVTPEEFSGCAKVGATALLDLYASKFPRGKKGKARQDLVNKLVDADCMSQAAEVPYLTRTK